MIKCYKEKKGGEAGDKIKGRREDRKEERREILKEFLLVLVWGR